MCKKLVKNSQPFPKFSENPRGGFVFDSHCSHMMCVSDENDKDDDDDELIMMLMTMMLQR